MSDRCVAMRVDFVAPRLFGLYVTYIMLLSARLVRGLTLRSHFRHDVLESMAYSSKLA